MLKIWRRCRWCNKWRLGSKYGMCDACGRFQ